MAFRRTFGILLAIGIFIAAVVIFGVLPTLDFRKQRETLTLIAQEYEQTWRQHDNESNQYTQYARLIDSQKKRVRAIRRLSAELQPETGCEWKDPDLLG